MHRAFSAVVALLFLALLSGCVFQLPAFSKTTETTETEDQPTGIEGFSKIKDSIMGGSGGMPVVHDAEFACENEQGVESRGYVLLMGLGGGERDKAFFSAQKKLMEQDPKMKFIEIYAQDADLQIEDISEQFLKDIHGWLDKNEVEELVIFGVSAGGVTASYSIHKLNFSGPVAVHTLASPIKGYELTGFREAFLGDRTGYLRDIAIGFEPFAPPKENVKIYHHKTVTDSVLTGYCGDLEAFCDPLKIQNNNVAGSRDFYYPELDHDTIVTFVVEKVLHCYFDFESDFIEALQDSNLHIGDFCFSEEECNTFCKDNFGICTQYCQENPENPLCQKPFAFEIGE